MAGWWRWTLVSPDGVAPSQMVGVSACVNLPLHHEVQKFSSGIGSPGWSRKKGHKMVVVEGSQFLSAAMKEMCRLLPLKQLVTTLYHPICNGLIEKFNGTLKNMFRHMCAEKPKDWDRYVGSLLFAYREVKQDSLGYSPFELLYGNFTSLQRLIKMSRLIQS